MGITIGRRSVMAEIGGDVVTRTSPPAVGVGEFAPADEKYEVLGSIGEGGMGAVTLVHDRDLKRDVAMKVLRDEYADHSAMKRRFVAEAQATSQLDHPGIPPVHDVGTTPQGAVYFTMKVVRGDTLSLVLRRLLLGVKEARQEYSLHRLITVLERIAEAVHFAHEKGVLHRDLKPDNIMLGAYGEVHVMDWGIAKVVTETGEAAAREDVVRTLETDQALLTQIGTVKGTIPYMSPEQARGELLDRRSDVYALGAILYEMLTLHPAFEGSGVALLLRVRSGEFPPVETRNLRRPVPESLAVLCRRAMAMDPAGRPATAHVFADELRVWLDGRAEKERRHKEAETLAAQGREALARYVAATNSIDMLERHAAAVGAQFKPWQSAEEKRPHFTARKAVEDAKQAVVLAFAETTKLLDGALLAESDNPTARGLLADLWRSRLEAAEHRNDRADTAHSMTMLHRYDDGRFAALLAGDGSLELTSDPPGARVALVRFEDDLGILVGGPERDLGPTPLARLPLQMGTYLAILRHPGFPDVRYPVHITRNRAWRGQVRLRTRTEIGEGFVYVPGGPFVYGEGKDMTTLDLPDFAIAEKPVTFGDWVEFVAAVEAERGLDEAMKFNLEVPAVGAYMQRTSDGSWRTDASRLAGEPALLRQDPDRVARFPALGVSWYDAVAYCEWKARITGREWRLPTEEEREKAARGVDGRMFTWGDREDPSLCKCLESTPEPLTQDPVGSFPTATSVYGMVNAAGGAFDWTSSLWGSAGGAASNCVNRGGSWNATARLSRSAYRHWNHPSVRADFLGFRPAKSLTP